MSISQEILTVLRRFKCLRFDEFELRKLMRQLMLPRKIIIVVLFVLFVICYIIFSKPSVDQPSLICLKEHLKPFVALVEDSEVSLWLNDQHIQFTGNGFIGMSDDGEVRIKGISSRVLSFSTAFFPLIEPQVAEYDGKSSAYVTDYRFGHIKRIQCFSILEECICVTRTVFAHRSRPNLLVQEITTTNPTNKQVDVRLTQQRSTLWTKSVGIADSFVLTRLLESKQFDTIMAVFCSSVPETLFIESNLEDISRFFCVFDYEHRLSGATDTNLKKKLSNRVTEKYFEITKMERSVLDAEHNATVKQINSVTFKISKSLAPNVLNSDMINWTRYLLIANTRDLLIENFSIIEQKQNDAQNSLEKLNMCYTGHSTLLIPSKLWMTPNTVNDLIRTVDIWLLTLEKRGCNHLIEAGARGVAYAFVCSLLAFKYTTPHLEMEMDPADLHREMAIENLPLSRNAKVSVAILLDADNRPYFRLSSSVPMVYACDAACLDTPVELSSSPIILPVKFTRPQTPILYISENMKHLEELHGTIHVIEVANAPAHEEDLMALHKHGHRLGGLPTAFWVLLLLLLVVFHLFLFKLVYSEWKKGDYTPYNYYLRQRYMRSHH